MEEDTWQNNKKDKMSIKGHTESEVRKAIVNKVKPKIIKGRHHDKGEIIVKGIEVSTIKIPNDHKRKYMGYKKLQKVAEKLRLTNEQCGELVSCTLKHKGYREILNKLYST